MLKFVYRYHTVRNEQEFHIDYLSKLPQFTVYLKNWIASIFLAPTFSKYLKCEVSSIGNLNVPIHPPPSSRDRMYINNKPIEFGLIG